MGYGSISNGIDFGDAANDDDFGFCPVDPDDGDFCTQLLNQITLKNLELALAEENGITAIILRKELENLFELYTALCGGA